MKRIKVLDNLLKNFDFIKLHKETGINIFTLVMEAESAVYSIYEDFHKEAKKEQTITYNYGRYQIIVESYKSIVDYQLQHVSVRSFETETSVKLK